MTTSSTKPFTFLMLIFCLYWLLRFFKYLRDRIKLFRLKGHSARIYQSKIVLRKLAKIKSNNQAIKYLRKIDPYVFEEVVLSHFAQSRFKIKRNRTYSRDGGIDGKIKVRGKIFLIQTKRYTKSVKTSDIQDLNLLCKKRRSQGLFIHTGKTPKNTGNHPKVQIIAATDLAMVLRQRAKIKPSSRLKPGPVKLMIVK